MRRRPLILSVTILAAILGGFTLGAMLSGQKEYQDDPVLVALDLFREICIPVSNGARPPFLQNKFDFTISELGPTWIDRPTGMSATVSDLGCSVSDVLNPLSIANRDRFAATAAAHTIEVFPQLSHQRRGRTRRLGIISRLDEPSIGRSPPLGDPPVPWRTSYRQT